MNTSKKGSQIERWGKEILEAQGYVVHRTIRTPVVLPGGRGYGSQANDVHGCFDLVARRSDGLRHIQTSMADKVAAKQRDVRKTIAEAWPVVAFAARFAEQPGVSLWPIITQEVWGWYGGRRAADKRAQCFRVTRWTGDFWEELPDEHRIFAAADAEEVGEL